MIKATFLMITLSFLLAGCGDSPFLDDSKSDNQAQKNIEDLQAKLFFKKNNLRLDFYWSQAPVIADESKILLILVNELGTPADPEGKLSSKIWMPSMGHGSYPISVTRLRTGVYELSEIFFTMEGYWDIHFQIYKAGELSEEVRWGIEL